MTIHTMRRRLEALEADARSAEAPLHFAVMPHDMTESEETWHAREVAPFEAEGRQVLVVRLVCSDGDGRPAPRKLVAVH